MERVFSFALGNIWRWNTSTNRNVLIDFVRKLDVSGVELTLATKEELYSFSLSWKNKRWLRRLSYVTIHAPFRLFKDSENEKEVLNQIDEISRIYDNINAKNVIIHPEDDLFNSDILKNCEFELSTENLPRTSGVSISDLRKVLTKHPRMRLCLDVSHAYSWSKFETGKLIKAFKDRISQIHFSGTYRKRDHQSLRGVSKDFLLSIQPMKNLEVPLVMEEDIEPRSFQYVKEELEYIRNLFD
jgi:hypothetical protein